mmetsp:Transcript_18784/g.51994  ORF Transcript_18784/g.51994 Transcript_18784/m.51994 type:complete len:228 (-) Transcript_18784:1951-2634(-)
MRLRARAQEREAASHTAPQPNGAVAAPAQDGAALAVIQNCQYAIRVRSLVRVACARDRLQLLPLQLPRPQTPVVTSTDDQAARGVEVEGSDPAGVAILDGRHQLQSAAFSSPNPQRAVEAAADDEACGGVELQREDALARVVDLPERGELPALELPCSQPAVHAGAQHGDTPLLRVVAVGCLHREDDAAVRLRDGVDRLAGPDVQPPELDGGVVTGAEGGFRGGLVP